MQTSFDVIVIGAGVAGLSTAMQLAKRGQSVVVLEREQLGNGSTGRPLDYWDNYAELLNRRGC